jgi:hypothetical protein
MLFSVKNSELQQTFLSCSINCNNCNFCSYCNLLPYNKNNNKNNDNDNYDTGIDVGDEDSGVCTVYSVLG